MDPAARARFAPWASPRLLALVEVGTTLRAGGPTGPAVLDALLVEHQLPRWPCLLEFEARFSDVAMGHLNLGILNTLRHDTSYCALDPQLFADPQLHVRDIGGYELTQGKPLVRVGIYDRDLAIFMDDRGWIYAVSALAEGAHPRGERVETWLERNALYGEVARIRHAQSDTGDHHVEIVGDVAESVAAHLSVPEVHEVADAVGRAFWDGTLLVASSPGVIEPSERVTQLICADSARLFEATLAAFERAWPGRQSPTPPELHVIGWWGPHTNSFAERLRTAGLPAQVRPTYP